MTHSARLRSVGMAAIALTLLGGCPLDLDTIEPGDVKADPAPSQTGGEPSFQRLSDLKHATYTDVAIGADGTIHALFRDTALAINDGHRVFYRASSDGGATWSPAVDLMEGDRERTAGFIRMVVDGKGRVYAFWKASPFSGLGYDEFPAGSLYGGSLVYRVLENGAWSGPVTIGPEKFVFSWFPAVDPNGQLHVVYNEGAVLEDGSRGSYTRSGVIQQVRVTGQTASAPVEVTRSQSEVEGFLGRKDLTFDGYEGLRGYVDAAGKPHFVAQKLPANKLGSVTDVVKWDGATETVLFPATQINAFDRFYKEPPQLLLDSSGREHLLVRDTKDRRHAVVDLDPAGGRAPVTLYQLAVATEHMDGVQVTQGPGGRMAAFVAARVGDKPHDLFVMTYDGTAWTVPLNVTHNDRLSSSFDHTVAGGDGLAAQFKWFAGYSAGAYDAKGKLNLVFLNAQGTTFQDTSTSATVGGAVQTTTVGGTAWPYVFFTTL